MYIYVYTIFSTDTFLIDGTLFYVSKRF